MPLRCENLVVLDFEATCRPGAPPVPQEIIEFPSVYVSLRDRAVVDSFESFVRPLHHPELDPFCTELTGIEQSDVATAPPFVEAQAAHLAWLSKHGLLELESDGSPRFVFVTCGDWDLSTMLPAQCAASGGSITDLPLVYRRWCNIKRVYGAVLHREKGLGMPAMLAGLGLELLGRHHRGIDDCHNIARIALALHERGGAFDITSKLPVSRYPSLALTLRCGEEKREVVLERRCLPSLLGLASGTFRTRMLQAMSRDGTNLTDDAICELPANSEVLVSSTAPPRL